MGNLRVLLCSKSSNIKTSYSIALSRQFVMRLKSVRNRCSTCLSLFRSLTLHKLTGGKYVLSVYLRSQLKYKRKKTVFLLQVGVIDPKKDWSANFCHMLGYDDPLFSELMRLYLVIHSDHEVIQLYSNLPFLITEDIKRYRSIFLYRLYRDLA